MDKRVAELQRLIDVHPELKPIRHNLDSTFRIIYNALKKGNVLYLCGNGGSAADAEHIAGELLKGFLKKRPLSRNRCAAIDAVCDDRQQADYLKENLQQGLRVISLTGHFALSTAMANDVAADLVFAQQLNAMAGKGDVLLAISTSGNAVNVNLCAHVAHALGMHVIGLTGQDGGDLNKVADTIIKVPANDTPSIQELHVPVYHTLCSMIEAAFFEF